MTDPSGAPGDELPHVVSVITRLARGGSERRLLDVLEAVAAHHTVVVGRDSDPDQIDRLAGRCEVVRDDQLVRAVEPRHDARAVAQLVGLLRRRPVDVVHTHQAKAGLLGRVAARAARVPLVYHSASMASFGPGYGRGASATFALAERSTARLVDCFFVVGTDLAERLRANGVAADRLQIVRSRIDLQAFRPAEPGERAELRRGLAIAPGRAVIVYVGSLEPRKNVAELPEIVASAAEGRDVTLLVAGDGPLRAAVCSAASAAPANVDVRVLGHVEGVAELIRSADALLLPSSAEGLPQVLVQAAASGVPFAAYDVDGVRELRALGAVGRVSSLGDREGLARALGLLAWPGGSCAAPDGPPAAAPPQQVWASWDADAIAAAYRDRYDADLRPRTGRR